VSSQATVERALRRNIGTGVWKPGEPLPSERDLAGRLGVGRSTLRAAIDVLRNEGMLVTSVGRNGRTRVAERSGDADPARVDPSMQQHIVDHFELRCAVEPVAAELAARRGTTTEFERLRGILRQTATNARAYFAMESQFHTAVADACGNPLIRDVVAELCVDFFCWADRLASARHPPASVIGHSFQTAHKAIYEALMTRDAPGARAAVEARLTADRDVYLAMCDDESSR
jgi:GntR family transcriptional repressor for pyruvate dehydrogenase complex